MKLEKIIEEKKEYRIAFLGGSITEGCGASKTDMKYSSQFIRLMNKRFPNVNFVEINAGIGGTPSPFGLFRIKNDVLDNKPDMLFIEFVVNDAGMDCRSYIEGIIRAARKYDPKMPIIMLITHCTKFLGTTRERPHESVSNHIQVAKAYKIPYVLMGYDMLERIIDFGGNDLFFTVDGCHPNDDGYRLYADSIMKSITYSDFTFDPIPNKPIFGKEYTPQMLKHSSLELDSGWKISELTSWSTSLKYIYSSTPGAKIKFSFNGKALGIFFMFDKDGGRASLEVDGQFQCYITCFNANCLQHDCFTHLDHFAEGNHNVVITMCSDRLEGSEGNTVRIVSFCVG